jgi:hypothetical protein
MLKLTDEGGKSAEQDGEIKGEGNGGKPEEIRESLGI